MGITRRAYRPGQSRDDLAGGIGGDAGSRSASWPDLAVGADGRFLPEHPRPCVGDRHGELTVVGLELGPMGGLRAVRVACSCGAEPHCVAISNLRKGRSTRCNRCAKKAAGRWTKEWFRYADICPDDAHRRRLCNRISACINRCHNPNDGAYYNYGGRGIRVYEPWRSDRAAYLAHLVTLDGWDRPELELDRIDVNRGYEPGNLRFIGRRANRNNVRRVRDLQQRIDELEACLRHCKCGAAQSVYGSDG
jgi:hypothetical protein